jgi:hypothetical protein
MSDQNAFYGQRTNRNCKAGFRNLPSHGEGERTTVHTVTLRQDAYQRLTAGNVAPEKLIEKSFEFLLERESNTSILCRFDLPVIGRYFPEYEKTIVKRL